MDMDLTGKTAIVTGASSGIGAATVRKLREAGVRVAGGARRVGRVEADIALELDVTDEASCAAFVDAAVAELGGVDILFMGSIAGRQAYPGGASYIAAKFAVRGFSYALREDLLGRPIRITTVDAGLVETEFSVVRFRGDKDAADAVYEGVDPVTPDEVADCVMFALTRPLHVNLDEIVIKAIAQSSGSHVVRNM